MKQASVTLSFSGISVERRIRSSPDRAWDLITDTTRWPQWGPSVTNVFCPDRYIRRGTRGRIRLPIGLTVPFQVTEYSHRAFWGWKVAGLPATGHRLLSLGDNACRIRFDMPVYWLPYIVVCKAALKRIAAILEG
jgi:hypothetical protein